MLEKQYRFHTNKARENARYKIRYKRKDDSPNIVRRFASPEMAYERIEELEALKLYSIELFKLSKKGNYARILKIKNGSATWRSTLPHHRRPPVRHVIQPKPLDPESKWQRHDTKARYGIACISKNRSN